MTAGAGSYMCMLLQAIEEAYCDMHLAATGTPSGLQAMQMVCYIPSIPMSTLEAAMRRAKQGVEQRLNHLEASKTEAI